MDIPTEINNLVQRRIPGSEANTITTDKGFELIVKSTVFANKGRADCEELVYNSIQELPLFVVAKIISIKTKAI